MTRSEQRQQIVELIYEKTFHEESVAVVIENAIEDRQIKVGEFVRRAVNGVFENLTEIDDLIQKHCIGWKISRIPKVSLIILRLSVYEMLFEDIPVGATINEAVELTKIYSDEDAGAFINGVLGAIAKECKK